MENAVRRYRVMHRTHYEYSTPSSLCHNQAHLKPRDFPGQNVVCSLIEISPRPSSHGNWVDVFGNFAEFFSIEELHECLTVTSTSLVERFPRPRVELDPMNFAYVSQWIREDHSPQTIEAREFLYDSRYCHASAEFEQFASDVIHGDKDFLEAILDLNRRIHMEFRYLPNSTHVTTRPIDSLRNRTGVCQDFAHVMICCFRALGIPARYVSGYLLTQPPPGKPKLVGADASHAWVSVYGGPLGWIDLDPTNNAMPSLDHITVAWGRDYSDVAPIQGVFVGGGFTTLTVSVDVSPDESEARHVGQTLHQQANKTQSSPQPPVFDSLPDPPARP